MQLPPSPPWRIYLGRLSSPGRTNRMHTYDIDGLYHTAAKDFWLARHRAIAAGGTNNIRAKGDGPETTIRNWIASVVGTNYRVTEGHVVRSDGRKSKQIDIIVVRNTATGTLYPSRQGEPELVRAECVAAVGEVKSSWYDHMDVLHSYGEMVREIENLQDGLLTKNGGRFGQTHGKTTIDELTRPSTGREWHNRCYCFIITLALGKCNVKHLADSITAQGRRSVDS